MTTTTMELPSLVCLCVLISCGVSSADANEPVKVVVMEGNDVILPCSLSTKEDIESKLFDWRKDGQKEVFLFNSGDQYNNNISDAQDRQFKGRVFHFQDELKHGNASIIVKKTKVADSGNYTCDFPHLQPRKKFYIELVVDCILRDRSEESISGAAKEPSIKILDQTNDGVLLQCVVRGVSPKPEVEWKDGSGNIVPAKEPKFTERGDKYDVIFKTAVTKTDHYRCVVTQKEINHQVYAETFVPVNGDSTGWIAAVSVLGIVVLLFVVWKLRKCFRKKIVGNVLFAKGIIEVDHIKSRRRHENGSENPPGSDHENGVCLRTEPLLPGSDVPAQQTSPV